MQEHRIQDIDHLMVVLLDRHLQIKPSELCKVAMRERVLSPENYQTITVNTGVCTKLGHCTCLGQLRTLVQSQQQWPSALRAGDFEQGMRCLLTNELWLCAPVLIEVPLK
jgi:hypothetical protein